MTSSFRHTPVLSKIAKMKP
uniref:Uncharacterized protein n=1 Tax=Rhizophora mucronata TaxID=61149 RepID=A0A2P2Q1J0_RHIMU